jgi:flagellar hook-length control protein FliK
MNLIIEGGEAVEVNMSKSLVNCTNDVLVGGDAKDLNNDNTSFYSIIAKQIQSDSLTNVTSDSNSIDLNKSIMDLVLSGNLSDETSTENTNNIQESIMNLVLSENLCDNISTTDIGVTNLFNKNLMPNDNQKDKTIDSAEIDYNNLMSLLLGITPDTAYSSIENVNTEDAINYFNQNVKQSFNVNNSIANEIYEKFIDIENYSKNTQDVIKSISLNQSEKSNYIGNTANDIDQKNFSEGPNNANKILEVTDGTGGTEGTEGINEMNTTDLKESLLKEIISPKEKESKNIVKNEIDFSKIGLENEKVAFLDNNKIIEVSDESSKIGNEVLSQVEDKIIMMTKDGIKYVSMELSPESLGKIDIKMFIEKEQMTVEIVALNKDTEKILVLHADELANILNKENDTSVNVVVKTNSDQINQYGQNSSNLNYNDDRNKNQNSTKDYTFSKNIKINNDESIITKVVNLNNLKLDKVI